MLGYKASPPSSACLGAPISPSQHSIIERLESMLDYFLHMPQFEGVDLGRAHGKFSELISHIQELPWCKLRLEDLNSISACLKFEFDPYGKHFAFPSSHSNEPEPECHRCDASTAAKPSVGAMQVQADRVKWKSPPSFQAGDFLDDPLVRAAFEDPEVLRKDHPARVRCPKAELLKLASKWDDLDACMLIPSSSKNFEEAVGLFCVPKDHLNDRLIVNPVTINSRMNTVTRSTKELAPGCMLGLLHLEDHQAFRFSADDLTDYYYTFVVSEQRAFRNALRLEFDASEVQHFKCFQPELEGQKVLICLKTLAMGDNLAVGVAQQSHGNVLRLLVGSLKPEETLRYRASIPRSDFIELLAIDDHVGLQKLPKADLPKNPYLRDSLVFEKAAKAYQKVGLIQQEKKQRRNQTSGVILGADFDGVAGKVMAPRSRIAVLCLITLVLAHKGRATPRILSTVLGCWIHVLLFRRVLFAIISSLFNEGRGLKQDDVFCLSRQSICELHLLATLGPLAQSDLRAKYSSRVYCTDASPAGGAVCYAQVGTKVSQEIWRHTEQRGFYTKLLSPASATLVEHGLDSDVADNFCSQPPSDPALMSPSVFNVPSSLSEGILYDCCEIFRGSGNWSAAHSFIGLTVHDGFGLDGRHLRCSDLCDDSTMHELLSLALRRVVRDFHAGVPLLSFGAFHKPQIRSNQYPFGFDTKDSLTAYHNKLAQRTCFVLTIALLSGAFISVEQPQNSRLYRLHCYRVLIRLGCVISHYAFCSFGSGFHKPSKWLHNKPWLVKLESKCTCGGSGSHFRIEGAFTTQSVQLFDSMCKPNAVSVYGRLPRPGEDVAAFSAAYPVPLVRRMALGLHAVTTGFSEHMPESVRERSLAEVEVVDSSLGATLVHESLYPPREWFDDPEWISELINSCAFHESFRFKFKKPGHINVNETRTFKSLIKSLAKTDPDTRSVALLDSRVTIGAAAKGRSSSYAISRVLQGTIPYIVGGGLFLGCLHCYSAENRADDPSRDRPVRPPSREQPAWLIELQQGKTWRFDQVVASSAIPKIAARWLRFLLLLGGDIERNPGPSERPHGRGKLDLTKGFAKVTSERMAKCIEGFRRWVEDEASISWDALVNNPQGVCMALRGYGLYCFETGLPRYLFVYAITGIQDVFPLTRNFMTLAWQIDKKWQIHEPGTCRSVLLPLVIRAAVCLGCMWSWHCWVAITLIGFAAMLHPSEMMALERRDLIFPADVCRDTESLFVRIRDPKTARFARRQHGRIDDQCIIQVAEHVFGALPPSTKLFPGSINVFRKQWNSIMLHLGVPHSQSDRGATPGVLRGSGATFLYTASEDLTWVAWRGRWARQRTLEYYLQEVGAFVLVHSLKPAAKFKIQQLSEAAWSVLYQTYALQGSNSRADG